MSEPPSTLVTCPVCGETATTRIRWQAEGDTPHAEIESYTCPTGCQVDDETVRQLIGAQ